MSERPCDVCKRPLREGGHATNPRECDQPNGEKCKLYEAVGRQARALGLCRAAADDHHAGKITNGEFSGIVREQARLGLDESIPVGSIFVQSWCTSGTDVYSQCFEDRNRLIVERDAAVKIVEAARKIANCTAGGSQICFEDVPAEYGTELQQALADLNRPRGPYTDIPRCAKCKKVLEDCGCDGFQGVLGRAP